MASVCQKSPDGATTILSVAYAVLLRPLPFPEANRLVQVIKKWHPPWSGQVETTSAFSQSEFLAWNGEELSSFARLAAYMGGEANLSGAGYAERVLCGNVSASLLPMLGATFAVGRGFLPEENISSASPVA